MKSSPALLYPSAALVDSKNSPQSDSHQPATRQFPHGCAGAPSPPVEPERLLPPRPSLHTCSATPPLLRSPPPRYRCPLRGRLQGHAQGDGLLGTRELGAGAGVSARPGHDAVEMPIREQRLGTLSRRAGWFKQGL